MCGIAGILFSEQVRLSDQSFKKMRAAIAYRGRDAEDEWTDGSIVHLFHTRLSVIDLSTGDQPMWDASGRYVIIYNGEIYNYKELRDKYLSLGAKFQTQSDTEVILEGFKHLGASVCEDLNGMFAFAIWDVQAKRLFLARDRLGKKPLFWFKAGGAFYFASSLDAFTGMPGWTGDLSPENIALYQKLGSFPLDLTVYRQARSLPAASYAWVEVDSDPRVQRYWQLQYSSKSNGSFIDLLDEYEGLLTDAIAVRLRSDVPVALTSSGWVDSGTIAAICARNLNTALACYTIDFHTQQDPSAEVLLAEDVAKVLGLQWTHIQFDYHNQLLAGLEDAYRLYDQPCVQLALVYSYNLYKTIRPFAKVVLSGNGSDELFTGYQGDEVARQQDIADKPGIIRGLFSRTKTVPLTWARSLFPAKDDKKTSPFLETVLVELARDMEQQGVNNHMDLMMFLRLALGGSDSNFRIPDISGLAAQVEVRSPYFDHRLVEFAARLPHQYKIGDPDNGHLNKYLPKVFYEKLVGKEIAWTSKKGMGYNLRWDESIAMAPEFKDAFISAYDNLDHNGLDSGHFRRAWGEYIAQKLGGVKFPATAGEMMSGFMLGEWLRRVHPALQVY